MVYDIIKVVVPCWVNNKFSGKVKYRVRFSEEYPLILFFDSEDQAIEYVQKLILKEGDR